MPPSPRSTARGWRFFIDVTKSAVTAEARDAGQLHRGMLRSPEKCARIGYDFVAEMTRILKRRNFARWQVGERLPDAALCKAVQEMESGLVDADLGGFLYTEVADPAEQVSYVIQADGLKSWSG